MGEDQGPGRRLCREISMLSPAEDSSRGSHEAHQMQSQTMWKAGTEDCEGPVPDTDFSETQKNQGAIFWRLS